MPSATISLIVLNTVERAISVSFAMVPLEQNTPRPSSLARSAMYAKMALRWADPTLREYTSVTTLWLTCSPPACAGRA